MAGAVRPRRRPARARRRPHHRAAPAGRDREVPAARPRRVHPRRADLGADGGGVARAVRACCARSCSDENRAVMLISHKLDEVLHATDRVTIMRNGRVVAERLTAETDRRRAGPRDDRPRGVAALGRRRGRRAPRGRRRGAVDGAVRGRRADPRRAVDPRRARGRARRAACCSTACRSTCARARSSAWPASRATARRRSATCCRACSTSTAGSVEVDGRARRAGPRRRAWPRPASA